MVVIITKMVTFMKEVLKEVNEEDMEDVGMLMDLFMKDNGLMVYMMDMECLYNVNHYYCLLFLILLGLIYCILFMYYSQR